MRTLMQSKTNRNNRKVMKRISVAMMLVLLTMAILSGCTGAQGKTNKDYKGQTIFGEVTKVSSDSLTIDVGTSNMPDGGKSGAPQGQPPEKPSDESSESKSDEQSDSKSGEQSDSKPGEKSDNKSGQPGEMPSMIKKNGDTATIKVDSETEITKNQMGPMGASGADGNGGNQNGGGQSGVPQKPDNDANGGTNDNGNNSQGEPPQGEPPQKPDNDTNGGSNNDSSDQKGNNTNNNNTQQVSAGPEQQGQPGSGETISLSDISEGDIVEITLDDNGKTTSIRVIGSSSNSNGQGGGNSAASVEYTAVKTYESDESVSGEKVESTGDDENALLVKDGDVDFDDMTITRKSGSSSGGDNASFYGLSAAVLGTGGNTYLKNSKITTDADGGAGVFAYGYGTVYVSDTKIKTSNGASGGIHAAGGGTLYAWDLDVTTAGQSSAAIRSDRGGGTMVVDGGDYTSTGNGSPAIYSTADITVNDADLTAKGSEAICIEGKNSIRLFDCSLSGNMSDDEQNDCTWNVILYQSMSGDSEEGTSVFHMDGGDLTAKNGGMFYTTNTSSKFVLKDVDIKYADENDFFLKATGNSNARGWGQAGSNGADCDFTAIDQDMEGDVIWDSISTLDFYMTDGSTLKGAVVKDDSNAGDGKSADDSDSSKSDDSACNVYIDPDSTWTVTGDSELTSLCNAGTIKDADGKTVTIKGTDGKVYEKGTGKYTITVEKYSTKDKTSDADEIASWSDYETEKPSQLA